MINFSYVLQLDLHTIEVAAHDFSDGNKMDEREFGRVFKVINFPYFFPFKLICANQVYPEDLTRWSYTTLKWSSPGNFKNASRQTKVLAKLLHRKLIKASLSSQGLKELRNEIALVAMFQHRKLVRLFGVCGEGEDQNTVIYFMWALY